ncbi:hypothetical protein KSF78_0008593 [Schistosoma japonicum]|nr:hypothetical protein KSF78_0008593 [Schistosoma japonicum]
MVMLIHVFSLIVDPNYMNTNAQLRILPLWFINIYCSIGPIVLLIDALICKVKRVNLVISLVITSTLMLTYIIYFEVLTVKYNIYLYQTFNELPILYRYLAYLIVLLTTSLISLLVYSLIRLFNRSNRVAVTRM